MVGVGGQLLDYIIADGLTLYQAQARMHLPSTYTYKYLHEINKWYERRRRLAGLIGHVAVAESFVANPNRTVAEIAKSVGVSTHIARAAISRYLSKPKESLTLKSKV